jgi:hypothetical protein
MISTSRAGAATIARIPTESEMKRTFGLMILTAISVAMVKAGDVKIEAMMTAGPNGREITAYTADAPKLYAMFKTKGATEGDKIRAVWIADDVGDAAPKGTKIDEKSLNVQGDIDNGEFSLSKPTDGWPTGKYHLEIYVNDDLATKLSFAIKAAAKSKKDEGEEESGD